MHTCTMLAGWFLSFQFAYNDWGGYNNQVAYNNQNVKKKKCENLFKFQGLY